MYVVYCMIMGERVLAEREREKEERHKGISNTKESLLSSPSTRVLPLRLFRTVIHWRVVSAQRCALTAGVKRTGKR
jgi:hypothetical protein